MMYIALVVILALVILVGIPLGWVIIQALPGLISIWRDIFPPKPSWGWKEIAEGKKKEGN